MEIKKIKELIKLAKEEGVNELEYESDKEKIGFKFSDVRHPHLSPSYPVHQEMSKTPPKTDLLEVKSPFVGTFYLAPSPGAPHYVKVGDRVSKGKILCIVEAMKIMNEIESEFSGTIAEICVENENYVEYGQVLFRIKP
jgi:acetyl-CoA carboxylase biotin carboxyl carrier protein